MRTTIPALLLLASCASEPPCDYASHVYLTEARELSGDCGPLSAGLRMPVATLPGCTRLDIPASGSCAIGRKQRCVEPDGSSVEATTTLHRDDDDATYVGHADVTLRERDGSIVCSSLYALTLSPQ